MFPSKLCEELMLKQMQMAVKALKMVNDQALCYIAYYNNKSMLPKGWFVDISFLHIVFLSLRFCLLKNMRTNLIALLVAALASVAL